MKQIVFPIVSKHVHDSVIIGGAVMDVRRARPHIERAAQVATAIYDVAPDVCKLEFESSKTHRYMSYVPQAVLPPDIWNGHNRTVFRELPDDWQPDYTGKEYLRWNDPWSTVYMSLFAWITLYHPDVRFQWVGSAASYPHLEIETRPVDYSDLADLLDLPKNIEIPRHPRQLSALEATSPV